MVTQYFTSEEFKTFTGFSARDFKIEGLQMSDPVLNDMIDQLQPAISQMVHRYCNVTSFIPTQVVEYKSGRGASDDDTQTSDYLNSDVEFYLRNLYLGATPVAFPIVVEEDLGSPTGAESWVTRTARSSLTGGDYRVITESELTCVRFHNNIPRQGNQNVRFTYYTGYLTTSDIFKDIKMSVMRCFKNLLMTKKKVQESTTVRNFGVRDYASMFEPFDESAILSESEKTALDRYKRLPLDGEMFW
jgi:hypothetical protein